MKEEIYFTTSLTETEHNIVHGLIQEECEKRNLELVYYRQFKEGHVPMYRECKIKGNLGKIIEALSNIEYLETDNANKKINYKGHKVRKCYLRDNTNLKCCKCPSGRYKETSIHDNMDGVLHCNNCNHKVDRYS